MNWFHVCWEGLDIAKKVLRAFVGQTAAKLWAVKVQGLKKILPLGQSWTSRGWPGFDSQMTRSSPKFDGPQIWRWFHPHGIKPRPHTHAVRGGPSGRIFFKPPTLTTCTIGLLTFKSGKNLKIGFVSQSFPFPYLFWASLLYWKKICQIRASQ